MTRGTSNRKQGAGGVASGSRPPPVFKGRDVVFVDPLDEKESYWWPAMIVPVPEIDSSMDCTVLNPGECLVKYFEDNKYSVVPLTDIQPFIPTTIPFISFEENCPEFRKSGGVVNALAYLESGKVKRKFSWNRWGTAQEQELGLDLNKHKAISLPLISDEMFVEQRPLSRGDSSFSSASSSPTTSTKSYSDSNEVNGRDSTSPTLMAVNHSHNSRHGGGALKNGLQRPLGGTASQGSSTLLPSPVSLDDLTESLDENEFNTRSNKSKDAPVGMARSRSRRGSREVDTKATAAVIEKDTSKRPRNTSDQSSSPVTLSSSTSQSTAAGTTLANAKTTLDSSANEGTKRRKTTSEPTAATDLHTGVPESGTISGRRPSQGSVDTSSSQRSTRHSVRNSKSVEGNQQGQSEDLVAETTQETPQPTRFPTQRMTRQRSAPKSMHSLPALLPSSPVREEKPSDIKDEVMASPPSTSENEQTHAIQAEPNDQADKATIVAEEETATAMDIDTQEGDTKPYSEREPSSSVPSSSSSNVTSTASSSSSPASIEPDEAMTGSTLSSPLTNTLLLSLEQDRRDMQYSFEHVLPTLAIGSKEREAFYETCMDHLQKLRQEHRRLKEILKNSDYTPKGRRATRSSPQYHANQRHHYLDEKPNRRHSPSRNSSSGSSSGSLTNGTSKEANGNSSTSSKSSSSANFSKADMATEALAQATLNAQQGSTPSSAILTSNISTTTRRSAATAAAAAVSRSSRQSYGSGADKGSETGVTKKRGSAAAIAAAAAAAAAAVAVNDSVGMNTRPKRRQQR
ncbi:MAG: hypothetical protein J3Q66DRAFT_395679 [Benniella sp.]|nr:MAG: hypothetical protein J3Q66DRAFT_395679 [Benniella sp.]